MVSRPSLQRPHWFFLYAPVIIWIAVILGLGSGVGASSETSRIIGPLLEFLFPDALPETLAIYHGYIRKFAHFAEYTVLGWLALRSFMASHGGVGKRAVLWAVVLVIIVASIDETNQSFNPDRTGSIYDVAIDLAGGLSGVAFFAVVARWKADRTAK